MVAVTDHAERLAGDHGARPFVALLESDLEFVQRNCDALDQRNHTVHT